jgi:hypothetical protein
LSWDGEGSHEAPLAQGGHYAMLRNTGFRHQSLEHVEEARQFTIHDYHYELSPDLVLVLSQAKVKMQ